MKYTVCLGFLKFKFDDGSTATNFAELALANYEPTEYNNELKPLIAIEKGEEIEEGEDDDNV